MSTEAERNADAYAAGVASGYAAGTETELAADLERLAKIIASLYVNVAGETPDAAERLAGMVIMTWQAKGVIRPAAAVRHEHGERIANAIDEQQWGVMDTTCVRRAAGIARDLSPPP